MPLESPTGQGNLCETIIVRYGEPDPILHECPVRYDETFHTGRQEHAYLEPEAALAIPQPDGSVTVHYNGQSPFINQSHMSQVLGLPPEKVRIIQPVVGGSFGGKDDLGYQCSGQVAALALKTGRPVKLVLGREESMIASYKREPMAIHFELGADAEGNLQAAKVEMLADSGCFSSMTTLAMLRASLHAAGAYRYRAVHVDTQAVYTNNGFSGAFRGFGNTDAAAAVEQAIDDLAHRLGRDPIDFRLQNCVRQGDRFMTGNVVEHEVKLAECLEWVRERSDWDRKRAAYAAQSGEVRRGLGVACYMHGSSLGGEGADYAHTTLRIESDYRITLTSGLTDYGQGSRTVFTLIAAETLGVDPARIQILRPDTDTALESGPTVASRSTMLGGNATRVAAEKLDRLLCYAAASALDCTPAQVTRHGELYVNPDEDEVSFEQVVDRAREMGLLLSVQGKWSMPHIEWHVETGTGTPYYCYTFGAQVAEVEVDTRIGQVRVLKVWAAHDGGTIVFPQGAYGQMYGGIAQGLGYGLLEEMVYRDGYPQALNFDDLPDPHQPGRARDRGDLSRKRVSRGSLRGQEPGRAGAGRHGAGHRQRGLSRHRGAPPHPAADAGAGAPGPGAAPGPGRGGLPAGVGLLSRLTAGPRHTPPRDEKVAPLLRQIR